MLSRIRVLAVARTQILRDGLSALICSLDMEVAATAETAQRAVELFLTTSPEITLMDLDFPDCVSIPAIEAMLGAKPEACIIGLLTDEWDEIGRAALSAGAWTCVSKDRLA